MKEEIKLSKKYLYTKTYCYFKEILVWDTILERWMKDEG